MESSDFQSILAALVTGEVDFVLVGALSAVLQGAPLTTFDVDIVHDRSPENVSRLLATLKVLDARYRQRPELEPTAQHLEGAGHQLLMTKLGPLDVLGHIEGGLEYRDLVAHSNLIRIADFEISALSPETYLELKRASDRLKDRAMVPLLEALFGGEAD